METRWGEIIEKENTKETGESYKELYKMLCVSVCLCVLYVLFN